MRRPKAKLGTLLLLLLCSFSLAHPQSPKPDLNDYANLAFEAVADRLKNEQYRIELVGPPVVPGDHASLHLTEVFVPSGRTFRPFVWVAVHNEQDQGLYIRVEFEAGRPQLFYEYESKDKTTWEYAIGDIERDLEFLELPASVETEFWERFRPVFTMSEKRQVTRELAAFWDAWLDVTRGPERFAPFLADEVECVFFPSVEEDLPPSLDAGSCVPNFLEAIAFYTWVCIESRCISALIPDYLVGDTLEKPLVLIRNEWREAGLFDPQHFALVRPYLGRHLEEGLIWKVPAAFLKWLEQDPESNPFLNPECKYLATQEEKIGCLNAWLSLLSEGFHYMLPVDERFLLFFGRKGTSLRLVAMMIGTWN